MMGEPELLVISKPWVMVTPGLARSSTWAGERVKSNICLIIGNGGENYRILIETSGLSARN